MKVNASMIGLIAGVAVPASISAFTFVPKSQPQCFKGRQRSQLQMGLFDGMKDAFNAPPSAGLDSERETPIDRWMGWNTKSVEEETLSVAQAPDNFIDAMDTSNYLTTALEKPMGIVFEENEDDFGGIFVVSLNEGGVAEKNGVIEPGDQLVAVNDKKVSGMPFDDALGAIIEAETEKTQLTFFRGTDKQLYGPTGASQEWLDELIINKIEA